MLRLVLIRPGETEYDQQQRVQGLLDVPLSDKGRQQVADMVEPLRELEATQLFYAPTRAALQVAETLEEELHIKSRAIDRLQNMNLGLWQGLCIDDIKSKQPKLFRQWQEHPETIRPPEGETVMQAAERVAETLQKLRKKYRGDDTCLMVVPEPLASVVANVVNHRPLGNLWDAASSAGKWEVLELEPAQTSHP